MSRWGGILSLLTLISVVAAPSLAAEPAPACANAHGWLFLVQGDQAVVLDPATNAIVPLENPPPLLEHTQRALAFTARLQPPRWNVLRTSTADGYDFTVRARGNGDVIHTATFRRRIEIAASTISPSARFTVFIQANNRASEITVLDAQTSRRLDLRIPHNADLAAFAIESAFSRGETCLALSMERFGGNGPEVWLVDLESGEIGPAHAGTIIGWA